MASILTLSFLAFNAISQRMQEQAFTPLFAKFDGLQLESARHELESGGKPALKQYLAELDRTFTGAHYLLDANGVDVLTGEPRAALLPPPPATTERVRKGGRWTIAHRAPDGKYWFAAAGQLGRPQLGTFLPYYFLVMATTGVLCWIAAVGVVSPVRRIAAVISQFGHGNLAARVVTRREDEIGQLGRSFNRMAERLEKLIVSERRLLGDISHELRSPLARLKVAVKLARTSGDSQAALDRIERDVDRIASLVHDIVEITSFEDDPALQGTELVSAGTIVEEVVRDCALEAQFRGCTIQVDGALTSQVVGNRELLRRAVENVLRNGIRYSPEKAKIELSVDEDERKATIAVRDYGPGVPGEALTRLFDPFFRVESARDSNGGGSGLGLSIAKRAVLLHRGAISAQNASPGLRVQITIPIARHA